MAEVFLHGTTWLHAKCANAAAQASEIAAMIPAVGSKVREKTPKHYHQGEVLDVLNNDIARSLVGNGETILWVAHDEIEAITEPTTTVLLHDPNLYNWEAT